MAVPVADEAEGTAPGVEDGDGVDVDASGVEDGDGVDVDAVGSSSGDARWWWLPPVLAPILVFGGPILQGQLIVPGDGWIYNLPMQVLVTDLWSDGILPAWNPYAFGGSPLLSNSQSAAFAPSTGLHFLLPPAMAIGVSLVLAFICAGLGTALLARRLTGDPVAASIAGVTFGLSGFMFAHVGHHGMVSAIAWLPWVLWAADRLRERFTAARVAAGSAIVALSILAGHPQMAALIAGTSALWALALAVAPDDRSSRWRPLAAVSAIGIGGVGLAAVHLLPVLAVLDHTSRAEISFEEAAAFSFEPTHLLLLGLPYLFGYGSGEGWYDAPYTGVWNLTELSAYVGAAAGALALIGLVSAWRDRRSRALLVVAVVALVVALGNTTPIGRLVHALPVVGGFRAWARYAVVVDLAVAIGAAHGVARLRRLDPHRRRRATTPALIVPVGLVAAGLVARELSAFEEFVSSGRSFVLAVAVPTAAAGAAVVIAAVAPRRLLGGLLVAVVALDMTVSFGWFYEWRLGAPDPDLVDAVYDGDDPFYGPTFDAPGGLDRIVLVGLDPQQARPWIAPTVPRQELRFLNGYDPLAPVEFLQTVGAMTYIGTMADPNALWIDGGVILDRLRVTTVLADPDTAPLPTFAEPHPIPGSRLVRFEREPLLPDAYIVGRAAPIGELSSAEVGRGSPFGGPLGTAVLFDEGSCEACTELTEAGRIGTAAAVHGNNSTHVRIDAERAGLLVVSRPWFPGWEAEVDGVRAPVVRVDGLTLGVPVAAGSSEVVLRYRPPGLVAGLALTTLTALGLVVAVVIERRRHVTTKPV